MGQLLGLGFAVSKTIENGNGIYIFIWYTAISNNWNWDFEKNSAGKWNWDPPSGPSDGKSGAKITKCTLSAEYVCTVVKNGLIHLEISSEGFPVFLVKLKVLQLGVFTDPGISFTVGYHSQDMSNIYISHNTCTTIRFCLSGENSMQVWHNFNNDTSNIIMPFSRIWISYSLDFKTSYPPKHQLVSFSYS